MHKDWYMYALWNAQLLEEAQHRCWLRQRAKRLGKARMRLVK